MMMLQLQSWVGPLQHMSRSFWRLEEVVCFKSRAIHDSECYLLKNWVKYWGNQAHVIVIILTLGIFCNAVRRGQRWRWFSSYATSEPGSGHLQYAGTSVEQASQLGVHAIKYDFSQKHIFQYLTVVYSFASSWLFLCLHRVWLKSKPKLLPSDHFDSHSPINLEIRTWLIA